MDMKKEHLKIYVVSESSYGNIFMWDEELKDARYYTSGDRNGFKKNGGNFRSCNFRLPTSEEEFWLLECIRLDRFIPFKELNFNKNYELWI